MATQTAKIYFDRGAMITTDYPHSTFPVPAVLRGEDGTVLEKIASIPEALYGKELVSTVVYVYSEAYFFKPASEPPSSDRGFYKAGDIDVFEEPWDEAEVTYKTRPKKYWSRQLEVPRESPGYQWCTYSTKRDDQCHILSYGVGFWPPKSLYTHAASSNRPYVIVTYQDPIIYLTDVSPQSGYVPKSAATVFSWRVAGERIVYGGVSQTAATLEWRAGSAGTVHSISVGTAQQYTMPAGTFTADEIQWRVTVTAAGQTKTSAWYTLSTVEQLPEAVPVSPIGGFVDGTQAVDFVWQHIIATGTAQTKVDLQTSADGAQWTTLRSVATAQQRLVIPADTLSAGALYWRVRTYNSDGAAGSWSSAVQTMVIAAPPAPVVTVADSSPRPLIQWQSSGQQAYEVMIDDAVVTTAYGVTQSYRADAYLADGQHTVRVRVQNQYSLWSAWGAVAITVANLAGSAITLAAVGGVNAMLRWTTEGTYSGYAVYRDGKLIAKTAQTEYTDRMTTGTHRYQVRGVYAGSGNYGLSNVATAAVELDCPVLTDVLTGEQILLPLSDSRDRKTTLSVNQQVSLMHYAGAALPSAEVSEWVDRTMSVTAAFRRGADASRILALRGRVCCLRDQYGNIATGVVTGWEINAGPFYTTYSTTITDIQWQEVLTHDPIA